MIICTVYSHHASSARIITTIQKKYPNVLLKNYQEDGSQIMEFKFRGGLFSSSSKLKITYRKRQNPSYQLLPEDTCPLSQNLKGLYGYVSSLPKKNEKIKGLFLKKIETLNSEFSISLEEGKMKDLNALVQSIAEAYDAILFVQPNTLFSNSNDQIFIDKNFRLIIDGQGNCEINDLAINIDSKYFAPTQIMDDQRERRKRSEAICIAHNVPIYTNPDSLFVESATTATLRTKDEIVDRAISLCYIELKSEGLESSHLESFDKKYNVATKLTDSEKYFAANENPTEQEMAQANWRAESYHTLLWALGFIETLTYPNEICNIGDDVKHLFSKTEQEFRDAARLRTKEEILDQADLILRLDWAVVNARVKREPAPGGLDSSIVYERHYALKWLINYQNQDWDYVTTNT